MSSKKKPYVNRILDILKAMNETKTNGDGVRSKDVFFAVVYFALSLPLSKGDSGPKGIKGYPGIPGLPVSIQTVSLFIFYFMPTMQDVF